LSVDSKVLKGNPLSLELTVVNCPAKSIMQKARMELEAMTRSFDLHSNAPCHSPELHVKEIHKYTNHERLNPTFQSKRQIFEM
jgi:hypothetical protein